MSKGLHVLVVDDEWSLRDLAKDILEGVGYQVTKAANPQEARAQLAKMGYSILITDNNMPSGTGIDLLRDIPEQYPDMARLLVSAERDALTAAAEMDIPGLEKPYRPFQLIAAVEQALSALTR